MKNIFCNSRNICFCSIAGYAPIWFEDWCKKNNALCLQFKKLAPKYSWWKKWHDKFKDDLNSKESQDYYTSLYNKTVLAKLNAKAIAQELANNTADICLLCYEKPADFCHRQLVSKWLNDNGILCKEYNQ